MINFEEYGVKKFPIPDALKHFLVLSETSTSSSEEIKGSMTCDINDYKEWLNALEIINENALLQPRKSFGGKHRFDFASRLYQCIAVFSLQKVGAL